MTKLWNALTTVIKLSDRIQRMDETIKRQQQKIETMNERLIRLETALQLGAIRPNTDSRNPGPNLIP